MKEVSLLKGIYLPDYYYFLKIYLSDSKCEGGGGAKGEGEEDPSLINEPNTGLRPGLIPGSWDLEPKADD